MGACLSTLLPSLRPVARPHPPWPFLSPQSVTKPIDSRAVRKIGDTAGLCRRASIFSLPTRRIPLAAIQDAAGAVYPVVRRTPLVPLDIGVPTAALQGCKLYAKLEMLQPIGSF